MDTSKTVRRRQTSNKPSINDAAIIKDYESHQGHGRFRTIILICAVVFTGTLSYGYVNSPLSSVTITDSHGTRANERNKDLQSGERFAEHLPGPESIAFDDSGNLYTGLADGRIVKIAKFATPQQSEIDLTKTASYTAGGSREGRRAFGIRIHKNTLFLADGYQGVFAINVNNLKWEKIVGYDDLPQPLMFPNDLVLTKDGKTLYFTDCSSRREFAKAAWSLIEGECSGRVLKVNLQTKTVSTFKSNLCFPNGIELSPDESKILVSEFGRQRLSIFELSSATLHKRILLPGGPDNIRRGMITGGYWVPLATLGAPTWYHTERFPILRDAIAGILDHDYLFYLSVIRHGASGSVVRLDDEFGVKSMHFDEGGKYCGFISEFHEYSKGKFLVGSYAVNGIVKYDWPKIPN